MNYFNPLFPPFLAKGGFEKLFSNLPLQVTSSHFRILLPILLDKFFVLNILVKKFSKQRGVGDTPYLF
ncbi:MAG: hypothetical protein A2026_01275 [Deltaproteobacteria bacterium RBG_19FT_COMBO_46_12]|nr:MAG: hypothetical protein A2026_01275 [Deltaproteobacteria bacterium RBG_19FT_COMBO_46_12]